MAFRDVRNFLLVSRADGIIDDEESIVLYDLYSSRDPDFPYDHYTAFDLDALDQKVKQSFVFVNGMYESYPTFCRFQTP